MCCNECTERAVLSLWWFFSGSSLGSLAGCGLTTVCGAAVAVADISTIGRILVGKEVVFGLVFVVVLEGRFPLSSQRPSHC